MPFINMHEAKTHLSRLVDRAMAGEEVIIARAGRPLVRVIPYQAAVGPRQFGQDRGQIQIADDFDELPPDLQEAFEGGA